ncbi:MAG: type II CRISPR-associated endonuclease Cas1 [Sphingopyxis sp.]
MQQHIVEISSDAVHLSAHRGFMKIEQNGAEIGRVPFDDIGAVIVRGHGSTFSVNLCTRLSEVGAPMVICGSNQSPTALLWPVQGHYEQGRRMEAQATLTRPQRKRLWRDLVIAKITAQASVLTATVGQNTRLERMAKEVLSGDASNLEAQAARRYWPLLMGEDFQRDRDQNGVNAALNYGYAVLRAGTARAILGAGLHPSLSIHHESRGDALRLADDMMEPFRPFVDIMVWQLHREGELGELAPDDKRRLASVLTLDLPGREGVSPIQIWLDRLALSFAKICMGESTALDLPLSPSALDLQRCAT